MARNAIAGNEMFAAKGAGEIYAAVLAALRKHLGATRGVPEIKQTCVHVTAGKGGTAFAGLHPRKNAVLLNIRLDAPLKSPRIRKVEQVSRNRFHCETILTSPADIDAEVLSWLERACGLASNS